MADHRALNASRRYRKQFKEEDEKIKIIKLDEEIIESVTNTL